MFGFLASLMQHTCVVQKCLPLALLQKAAELAKSEQWCLNSDGTTLQQVKKVAFLINGIVLGVHDVSDGSSQTALDALKAELHKIGKSGSYRIIYFRWCFSTV